MLTFEELRKQNGDRAVRWHEDSEAWTGADWATALGGEAGEALNVVKKMRRHETGIQGGPHGPLPFNTADYDTLREKLGFEIADVILYADLLATHYGINLEEAVREKFNAVSEAQGFPERV